MRNDNKLSDGKVELGVCDSQNLLTVVLCDPVHIVLIFSVKFCVISSRDKLRDHAELSIVGACIKYRFLA